MYTPGERLKTKLQAFLIVDTYMNQALKDEVVLEYSACLIGLSYFPPK